MLIESLNNTKNIGCIFLRLKAQKKQFVKHELGLGVGA